MEAGAPSFELPPQPPSPEQGEQGQEQAIEAPPARQEQVGKQAPKAPALPAIPDDIPAVDQPAIPAPPAATPSIPNDPHAMASDNDNMEKVWRDKTDSVLARTKDDPHQRTVDMSKVKAEYNLKRFNKQIKSDEAAA